jgi:hypothetical protein
MEIVISELKPGERVRTGHVYAHVVPGMYLLCIDDIFGMANGAAILANIRSGWTFAAHGIHGHEDGRIDWDYSTEGRFVDGNRYDYLPPTWKAKAVLK